MASTSASRFKLPTQTFSAMRSIGNTKANPSVSNSLACTIIGASLPMSWTKKNRTVKISRKVTAAAAVATTSMEEITEYALPSWALFELGRAPVYWKTMNGLPLASGEKLKLFYNPAATKLDPNEDFGIAFNGGFNQPIMYGGEPRAMLKKA